MEVWDQCQLRHLQQHYQQRHNNLIGFDREIEAIQCHDEDDPEVPEPEPVTREPEETKTSLEIIIQFQ
jgi:hypothetical protein